MKLGYVRGLDGLRALAIILVMSFHVGLNQFGWLGVQLFFCAFRFSDHRNFMESKRRLQSHRFQTEKILDPPFVTHLPLIFWRFDLNGYPLFVFPVPALLSEIYSLPRNVHF